MNKVTAERVYAIRARAEGMSDEIRKDIVFLFDLIKDMAVDVREAEAWEGRYNALLEGCEASRPREIDGGEASRGAADRTVAIDAHGCPWARVDPGCWFPLRIDVDSEVTELPEEAGPYTIVYTPWAKWPLGRDSWPATTSLFRFG